MCIRDRKTICSIWPGRARSLTAPPRSPWRRDIDECIALSGSSLGSRHDLARFGLRRFVLLTDRHDAEHDAALAEILGGDALYVESGHGLRFRVVDREAVARIAVV